MEEILLRILNDALLLLAALIAAFFIAFLKKKLGTEKLRQIESELITKQELAMLAVRFIQQVYWDYEGEEKYNKAARWLTARVVELGLKIESDEVKGLIESALRALKDEFGEEWARQVSSSAGTDA